MEKRRTRHAVRADQRRQEDQRAEENLHRDLRRLFCQEIPLTMRQKKQYFGIGEEFERQNLWRIHPLCLGVQYHWLV